MTQKSTRSYTNNFICFINPLHRLLVITLYHPAMNVNHRFLVYIGPKKQHHGLFSHGLPILIYGIATRDSLTYLFCHHPQHDAEINMLLHTLPSHNERKPSISCLYSAKEKHHGLFSHGLPRFMYGIETREHRAFLCTPSYHPIML